MEYKSILQSVIQIMRSKELEVLERRRLINELAEFESDFLMIIYVAYQENSHPKNSHPKISHQSNSTLVNSLGKSTSRKFSAGIFPPRFLNIPLGFLSPLSLILLERLFYNSMF